jgi:uncharacterized protein (DUF2141 family)
LIAVLAGALPVAGGMAGAEDRAEADASASRAGGDGAAGLQVRVTGLRNGRGKIMACLVSEPKDFPDCTGKAGARHVVVNADQGEVVLDFGVVPAGTYALSLFHDENGNGKLDTAMMIPREGYGFSRDAPVRFGPPRFAQAAFAVGPGANRQAVKVRYLL